MIYLDNAAGTSMLPEVIELMKESMLENYGNPSSIHKLGRKAKSAIELVRKNIAKQFNVLSSEIIFTSSGTEGDNFILKNAVEHLKVTHIVSSKIEHHAVLNVLEYLINKYGIIVSYVNVTENGSVDLEHLEEILVTTKQKTLVSLMSVNNEIGNLLPIVKVSEICKKYDVLFHSDTVQAIGHYSLDLQKTPIDFITASAHKFHGPKGVGFIYVKKGISKQPILYGGGQEKGIRSSTENVHSIIGMGKALELAYENLEIDVAYQKSLKKYFINELKKYSLELKFNGLSADLDKSSYTIINVRFPKIDKMFLFNLDLQGIAASGGSACQSGSSKGSHVLQAFLNDDEQQMASIRFSISKLTTKEEVQKVLKVLEKLI